MQPHEDWRCRAAVSSRCPHLIREENLVVAKIGIGMRLGRFGNRWIEQHSVDIIEERTTSRRCTGCPWLWQARVIEMLIALLSLNDHGSSEKPQGENFPHPVVACQHITNNPLAISRSRTCRCSRGSSCRRVHSARFAILAWHVSETAPVYGLPAAITHYTLPRRQSRELHSTSSPH